MLDLYEKQGLEKKQILQPTEPTKSTQDRDDVRFGKNIVYTRKTNTIQESAMSMNPIQHYMSKLFFLIL